eukprot:gene21699-24606_t
MAYVLAGGRGSRLKELTDRRAKPAVYFGGKARIIDFALSNALNSGIRRIGVATQYKAHSLIRHLQLGWNFFRPERNESFDILPASQRVSETQWYEGTADAVYQNADIIESYAPEYMVILAGDHIYKMDYELMLQQQGIGEIRLLRPALVAAAQRPVNVLDATAEGREVSSTQTFVRILTTLLKDPSIGARVVPILVDESRTFGMEGLFRQVGIFNQQGQLYEPVDKDQVMYYREDKAGQILQEGINEAGGMSSWIAAATSYSTNNRVMIPFYTYYSMFGMQRIGDLVWAAAHQEAARFEGADVLVRVDLAHAAHALGDAGVEVTPGPLEQILEEMLLEVLSRQGSRVGLVVDGSDRHVRVTVTVENAVARTHETGPLERAGTVVDAVGGRMSGDLAAPRGARRAGVDTSAVPRAAVVSTLVAGVQGPVPLLPQRLGRLAVTSAKAKSGGGGRGQAPSRMTTHVNCWSAPPGVRCTRVCAPVTVKAGAKSAPSPAAEWRAVGRPEQAVGPSGPKVARTS